VLPIACNRTVVGAWEKWSVVPANTTAETTTTVASEITILPAIH